MPVYPQKCVLEPIFDFPGVPKSTLVRHFRPQSRQKSSPADPGECPRADLGAINLTEALGQAGEPWQVEVPLSKFKSKTEHRPDLPIGMELTDIWVFSPEESAELEIHRVEFLPKEVDQ